MELIKKVSLTAEGFQITKDKGEIIHCAEIRGAVAPPTTCAPGYYLIVGRLFEKNQSGRCPLVFLAEGESGLQGELLGKLISDLCRLKCQVLYADQRQELFFLSLHRRILGIKDTLLHQSVFIEQDDPGIALIRDWLADRSLEVHKTPPTILRRELEKMTDDSTSYVIAPLKLLLVGFETQGELFLPPWGPEDRRKELRTGLTGASRAAWEELDRIRRQYEDDDDWTALD